jgi:hypothetical protein
MRRRSVVTAVLSSAFAGVFAVARTAAAQDATPPAVAAHPVVGAWVLDNDPAFPGALVSYGAFHADGTVTALHPLAGTGIGVWHATGAQAGQLTVKHVNIASTPGGFEAGTGTIRAAFAVDRTGTALTVEADIELRTPGGTVVDAFPNVWTGTRLAVEPIGPGDAPGAGTPTA